MKRFTLIVLVVLTYTASASDSLKIENRKILSIKSNLAVLILHGFSLQTEYVLNKHCGVWTEVSHHKEDNSVFNAPLRETNFLAGLNYYSPFKNPIGPQIHNGVYFGPYIKTKSGCYCLAREINYTAVFAGIQGGVQSVSKQNIIFNMGMGFGVGYFINQEEKVHTSLFEKYNLPLMDFRANISFGYLF